MPPTRSRLASALINAALVLGSVTVCFLATETFLWAYSALNSGAVAPAPPSAVAPPNLSGEIAVPPDLLALEAKRHALLTLPPEWEWKDVVVPGARGAYRWQGVLHVVNERGMRRTTPFPEKQPGVYRVIVLGDSLTYGAGIAEQNTFTALLNAWMAPNHAIEFLNLGMTGGNSTDMLKNLTDLLPQLRPDLVIYAMCLNDFLHQTEREYKYYSYAFPIPEPVQRFFIGHTFTGAFMAGLYDRTLRRLHLRRDFFDDILSDFGGRRERFRRDVAEMNATVRAAGLPAMITMVVDQFPNYLGRSYQIAQIAGRCLPASEHRCDPDRALLPPL
jgi:GDSL-like Lipase/Acylhydrolase family